MRSPARPGRDRIGRRDGLRALGKPSSILVEAAVAAPGSSALAGQCRAHAAGGKGAGSNRTERPELVALDLMLPGADGIEAEVPELCDLPVIVLSGDGRDETIARAFVSQLRAKLSVGDRMARPGET